MPEVDPFISGLSKNVSVFAVCKAAPILTKEKKKKLMIQGFNTFPYSSELFMFVIHGASFPFLKGITLLLAEILE